MTDPSYRRQIVTMTYPLIGNCGICPEDAESSRIQVAGLVVREVANEPSNFRANKSLSQYLRENQIIGLSNVDTRALTRKIRLQGAMKSVLSSEILDDQELVRLARASQGLVGLDLVQDVTCSKSQVWAKGY